MELFHVHTHRCMHASDENDEAYIVKAIQMGASHIYFTDHAPFPGDPFRNRMGINQLEEYFVHAKEILLLGIILGALQ